MIDPIEAEKIHDALIRRLYEKVLSDECTAADMNVLRQMLKDNEFRGIQAAPQSPIRSVSDFPFPEPHQAHG